MIETFEDEGIRFRYPANWKLSREESEQGWTVTVQSPGTAFLLLTLRHDAPMPNEMADTALEALREDYADLEADESVGSVAGQPAIGHDIRFFSLDLTNSAWTRSFFSPSGTIFLMWQINDLELEKTEPVLRAICASLELDD